MGDQDSRLRLTSSNKKKVSGSHEESEANIAQKGTYYFAQWIDKQIVFTKLLYLKFIYSEKATQNFAKSFDYSTYSQKLGEDFAKFCGPLRIYEL